MTTVVEVGWVAAPEIPPAAAPLLAVDGWRCRERSGGYELTVRLRVRGDDPNLRGHFPGRAILPGVFIIEALSQGMALAFAGPGGPVELCALRSVRFFAPLPDGDELTLTAAVTPDGTSAVTPDGTSAVTPDGTSAVTPDGTSAVTPDGTPGRAARWSVRAEGRRRDGTTAARIRADFRIGGPADA